MRRAQLRRRRALLLAGGVLVAVAAALAVVLGPSGGRNEAPPSTVARETRATADPAHAPTLPTRLTERTSTSLSSPEQDAAAVGLGAGRVMLVGGLTAADTSRADIRIVGVGGDHRVGSLPVGLHDTAAVRIGGAVYVFGGGTATNTQSDQIVRVSVPGAHTAVVGRLPAPSSDQAATVVDGTAYIIGGFTGSTWLSTIVAWRPGTTAHVVARLPAPIRYAAVTTANGRVVIAGGSVPDGTASAAVYLYRPGSGLVVRAGALPAPTTHAAAVTVGRTAYVIGGRGTNLNTPTARIVAVDPSGRVRAAGSLSSPRSDLAAVATGKRLLLLGGRGPQGTESTVSELVPASSHRQAQASTARKGRKANVYAFDGAGMLAGAARYARPLVYVPNSEAATVDVIDPRTYKVVEHFSVGLLPQHVVPSFDLKTLYVTNDVGNSLTVIDPRTGTPGRQIPVEDPYNMYFTPSGRYAIVVAERLHRLDFRDPHTFKLRHSLSVPCVGVDHMDFSADGRYLIASCEFSGQLVKVDIASQRVVGVLNLPDGRRGQPQDVRISPSGNVFYVADLAANGVWKVDGRRLRVIGFVRTGVGAHGLYPSRNGKDLYVSNRGEGSVSVISFKTQKVVAKWHIPGGGSPDMGGVSADGKLLWLSGRYNSDVYAISTRTGRLVARIPVGAGPHGLCVWPQPGRYSLGHTDNMR